MRRRCSLAPSHPPHGQWLPLPYFNSVGPETREGLTASPNHTARRGRARDLDPGQLRPLPASLATVAVVPDRSPTGAGRGSVPPRGGESESLMGTRNPAPKVPHGYSALQREVKGPQHRTVGPATPIHQRPSVQQPPHICPTDTHRHTLTLSTPSSEDTHSLPGKASPSSLSFLCGLSNSPWFLVLATLLPPHTGFGSLAEEGVREMWVWRGVLLAFPCTGRSPRTGLQREWSQAPSWGRGTVTECSTPVSGAL